MTEIQITPNCLKYGAEEDDGGDASLQNHGRVDLVDVVLHQAHPCV